MRGLVILGYKDSQTCEQTLSDAVDPYKQQLYNPSTIGICFLHSKNLRPSRGEPEPNEYERLVRKKHLRKLHRRLVRLDDLAPGSTSRNINLAQKTWQGLNGPRGPMLPRTTEHPFGTYKTPHNEFLRLALREQWYGRPEP